MNKVAIATLSTLLAFAGSNAVFAEEESRRGEMATPEDSLPRNNQESIPNDTKQSRNQSSGLPSSSSKKSSHGKEKAYDFNSVDTGFIEDSHLYLNFRNQYERRSYKHATASGLTTPAGWKQWAQGVSVDFVSGYGLGVFGIDASLYGALKLDGNNPQNAKDELLHTEKNYTRYSKTYSRIGRLNAKFHLGNADNNAVLRYGLIGVDTALVADSDSRLLESSYRGASVDANLAELNNLQLYGFYLDRLALRTGNSYDRFRSSLGKDINNIQVYGTSYTIDNLGGGVNDYLYLNGEFGISKDYTKQYFGQASYHLAFNERYSLLANIQYRQAEKAGNLWDPKTSGFDDKARNINANIMGAINRIKVALSYAHTRAKNNQQQGVNSHQFNPQLTANEYGKATYWTSRQISNFNYDKENAYQAMFGYDFTDCGATGLSASLTHTYGTDINKNVGLKNEQETDLNIVYEFQQSQLKGLSLKLEQAWYVSRGITGSTLANGKRLTDLRAYANYNVAVF